MADRAGSNVGDKANLSMWLGIATAVAWGVGGFISGESGDENGWIWILMLLLGIGAVATGLMARQDGRFSGKAVVGLVLGGLFVLLFVLFAVGIMG